MFDLPPTIEQHCPQETVQLVTEIKKTDNADVLFDVFNTPKWDPCLDSVLEFLFFTLEGTENLEYMRELLYFSMNPKLTKETKEIIYERVKDIPYIDKNHYVSRYFAFLRYFEVKPTSAIRNIELSNSSQEWHRDLYLSYMNDWDAFERIFTRLKLEPDASVVLELADYLYRHPLKMREKILKEFQNDQRIIRHLIEDANPYTEFMLIDLLKKSLNFNGELSL